MHRDIKAQNVLLTEDGGVKLADFGIARLIETDGEAGLTKTDMLLGSADYLSPEQADGRPIDARTDIYSLGILLYECLTGVLPFRGEGFVAVAMKQCSEPLPDPRLTSPGVPEWLAACTIRAAAKEPAARYPDAARMEAALEGRDPGTAVMPAIAMPAGEDEGDTARRRRPRRRRAIWAVCLVALVLVAGGVGALLLVNRDEATAPPPVAAVPLTISAVRDYDPQGNDKAENPGERGFAVDNDPTTAWYTEQYRDTPQFGGLKSGVGLILRLTAPAVATEMVVTSPTPGATFEVQGPLVAGTREVLAKGTLSGPDQVIPLASAAASEVYVLWITSLVPDQRGGYWAGVGQVQLRGIPKTT